MTTITIKGASYSPETKGEGGAVVSPGFWTATVAIDGPDGCRISPERFDLPADASEGDMIGELKTRWASVPDASKVSAASKTKLATKFG